VAILHNIFAQNYEKSNSASFQTIETIFSRFSLKTQW